ncbi:hypothetical protein PGT21_031019 [Puccinia graminis f. sp. tritici]|uniref:Fungal lipase-type domain-containing protein n=1 Tax=Puccinia graminis f. sp. tritici TaxID=56615 RepID=A0A5B0R6N9_PUCGR|nr:hypothetical protein PGT21_031019 [Puccinia graminis f. sp. tritici]KAA1120655.1 hypothetical protein PGTUg99_018041 [Puccinia graminis f. sp. tritici]
MIIGRTEALIFFTSLVGLSGAHRAIRPRALPSTQTESSGTPQTNTNPPMLNTASDNTPKTVSNRTPSTVPDPSRSTVPTRNPNTVASSSPDTGSDARNTGSNALNTGSDARNTGSNARNTGSNALSTGSDARNTGSSARNTGSSARNTGSSARNTGSSALNTESNPRDTGSSTSTNSTYPPDHPDWEYLNGIPWWKTDPTQQDHLRFHCYLSMASYGDYTTLCPSTFTKGFTVLEEFSTKAGQAGFTALIPEMEKVVIVFRGFENDDALNWNPVTMEDLVENCPGCQVAAGVKKLYLSVKEATNNWEVAKKKVAETGLKFSVTGHGIGGAVAALAGLELGAQGYVHYSHNQGMPRAFNYAAAVRYDNLFQVLAGQSIVSENDYMVQKYPLGPFYHLGTKVKITGEMQQWLTNCYGNNENSTCIGTGNNVPIHDTYFTPKGQCGSADKGW